MVLVNFGCGDTYHPEWLNFDLYPKSNLVKKFDIRDKLPFDDESVDVCYSSHLLEHLSFNEAYYFIKEQYRILKNKGIIRIVVPDLEQICKNYLYYLEETINNYNEGNEFKYDYSYFEMYDQTTRANSGGELRNIWEAAINNKKNIEFIIYRHGNEFLKYINENKIIKRNDIHLYFKKILSGLKRIKFYLIELIIYLFLGHKYVLYFREGCFRNSGEIHKVMYDRFRLQRLLNNNGFKDFSIKTATDSLIPNFINYNLDFKDNKVLKPDSIFIEAIKK